VLDSGVRHEAICADARGAWCSLSDNWLRLIPTDPTFVPGAADARRTLELLEQFAPAAVTGEAAGEVNAEAVVFIDAGTNFGSVTCPWCGAAIDIGWWQDCMGVAAESEFNDLLTRTRCCDVTTSLNDLNYEWSQGFARWWLEVMNPATPALSRQQLDALSDALGHLVRAVYVHD
jgi:hypothetical protein